MDAYRIYPHLYQGPVPPSVEAVVGRRFSVLVLCATEIQPFIPPRPDLVVLRCPLVDDITRAIPEDDWNAAQATAQDLAGRLYRGHRALVTCQAGLNRSGLVTALTLTHLVGMSGKDAVDTVRRGRGANALFNGQFVKRLYEIPARRRTG